MIHAVIVGIAFAIFQGVINLFVKGLDPISVGMIAGAAGYVVLSWMEWEGAR